jgi:SAM-dependent methyltransferase
MPRGWPAEVRKDDRDVVLDVGCDSATISRLVAPHTKRFGGADFITAMLKDAARLNVATADGHPAWFAAADACHLPFRSHAFTKAYCSAMLHTLPTREHGLEAIDELIRVTAARGIVLLSSVPDQAKRMAARFDLWKRAGWNGYLCLSDGWSRAPSSSSGVERCDSLRPVCPNFSTTTSARCFGVREQREDAEYDGELHGQSLLTSSAFNCVDRFVVPDAGRVHGNHVAQRLRRKAGR